MDTQQMSTQAQPQTQMASERNEPNQVLATTTLDKNSGEKTSDFYRTENLPQRFENPGVFEGYDSKPQNPLYYTTNMRYGSIPPSVHTVPTSFHARTNKFSEHLLECGMYRNEGLNTS